MRFIHKNINTALLMLIAFISTALAATAGTATVLYDSLHEKNAVLSREAKELSIALSEQQYRATQLQAVVEQTAKREEKLVKILEQEREEEQKPEQERATPARTQSKSSAPKSRTGYAFNYRTSGYVSPYRLPSLTYV